MITCEVKDCPEYPTHQFALLEVTIRVCDEHRRATRKLQLKYGIKLMESKAAIFEEFLDAVAAIGGK